MTHPDFDTEPSKCPFDRYPVAAWRVEQGERSEERFLVLELDLPNDNRGPIKPPAPMSEVQARAWLAELGRVGNGSRRANHVGETLAGNTRVEARRRAGYVASASVIVTEPADYILSGDAM